MSIAPLCGDDWDSEDQPKLRSIVRYALQQGLATCVDPTDTPFVSITSQEPAEWLPLTSDRIRGWISKLAFDLGHVLRREEVNAIVELLKGFAFENRHATVLPERLWSVAEDDPVLRAVILFMEPRPYWSGLMASLLDELRKVNAAAESHGSKRLRLPATANQLSVSLRKLKLLMEQAGLLYSWRRTAQGANASLRKMVNPDDDDAVSSGSSSHASAECIRQNAAKQESHDDDDDRRICERIRRKTK